MSLPSLCLSLSFSPDSRRHPNPDTDNPSLRQSGFHHRIPLCSGYYKRKEAIQRTVDSKGWLHTSDIGYIDKDDGNKMIPMRILIYERLRMDSWSQSKIKFSSCCYVGKAIELDIPKEILEHNIKRASEKGQEAYIGKFYEVYDFGGVDLVVEVLIDKINRSMATVREVVKDCGGQMADPGSILFKFKRARVVNIKVADAKDQLLAHCFICVEDVIKPLVYEDGLEDTSERTWLQTYLKAFQMVLPKIIRKQFFKQNLDCSQPIIVDSGMA